LKTQIQSKSRKTERAGPIRRVCDTQCFDLAQWSACLVNFWHFVEKYGGKRNCHSACLKSKTENYFGVPPLHLFLSKAEKQTLRRDSIKERKGKRTDRQESRSQLEVRNRGEEPTRDEGTTTTTNKELSPLLRLSASSLLFVPAARPDENPLFKQRFENAFASHFCACPNKMAFPSNTVHLRQMA